MIWKGCGKNGYWAINGQACDLSFVKPCLYPLFSRNREVYPATFEKIYNLPATDR